MYIGDAMEEKEKHLRLRTGIILSLLIGSIYGYGCTAYAADDNFVDKQKIASDEAIIKAASTGNQVVKAGNVENNGKVESRRPTSKIVPTRKQKISRDFYAFDDVHKRKVPMRLPVITKDVKDVDDWTLLSLSKLSDRGLLNPGDIREFEVEPNRELMAKLISRAYHRNETEKGRYYEDNKQELGKLMVEYDDELRNLGYGADDYTNYAYVKQNRSLEIYGEVRQHYVKNTGDPKFDSRDSRLRARLYARQHLNNDWSITGMVESDKSWLHDDLHGRVKLDRLFVEGQHKGVHILGGKFGEYYADGNVYDGTLTGGAFDTGRIVKIHGAYGYLRDKEHGAAIVATYPRPKYEAEAGVYSFKDIKGSKRDTVTSWGYTHFLNQYSLGAMLLTSSQKGADGKNIGYVLSARYNRIRPWIPHTYEIFVKYYDQAQMTYFGHTMVGLADRMEGFKGVGLGFYYTLLPNVVYAFEYYDLQEKSTGKKGRTLWNHVSYYF